MLEETKGSSMVLWRFTFDHISVEPWLCHLHLNALGNDLTEDFHKTEAQFRKERKQHTEPQAISFSFLKLYNSPNSDP